MLQRWRVDFVLLGQHRTAEAPEGFGADVLRIALEVAGCVGPEMGRRLPVSKVSGPWVRHGGITYWAAEGPFSLEVRSFESLGYAAMCSLVAAGAAHLEVETGDGARVRVVRVEALGRPQCHAELLEAGFARGYFERAHVGLVTPAVIREGGGEAAGTGAFPGPAELLGHLFALWDAFSDVRLGVVPDQLSGWLGVGPYKLSARPVRWDGDRGEGRGWGIQGRIQYVSAEGLPDFDAGMIRALLWFGTYAGVGRGVARGFGQLRVNIS